MNERLQKIEDMASLYPEKALDSLNLIDYEKLSSANKHYYDFLSVKVSDKAYITHTSDSLILKIIDYESKHRNSGRYVESLYYGGRVYSDLGDIPTSLQYFQDAIEKLPSDEKNLDLKGNIYSQYGRMLARLRLYRESIPYIRTSLEVGRLQKDTINIIYDSQLLGEVYLKSDSLDLAKKLFYYAIKVSKNQPHYHTAKSKMFLGETFKRLGIIDSALHFIRKTPEQVRQRVRIYAVAYAAQIYLQAGIKDTAYIYAKELIESPDTRLRDLGYHILLSERLKDYSSVDTLKKYISDYRKLLEIFYDENSNQLSLNQRALYNYNLHKREKEKEHKKNSLLMIILLSFSIIILMLLYGVLFYKHRNQKNILRLRETLDNIRILKAQLDLVPNNIQIENRTKTEAALIPTPETELRMNQEKNLKEQLRKELLDLYENAENKTETADTILKSEIYEKINKLISDGKIIDDDDNQLWLEVENVVMKCSPNFKTNLLLLSSGHLSVSDYHTSLLIKCGLKPKQMQLLFGRSHSAIGSRRKSLGKKFFSEDMEPSKIDAIIRLL